MKVGVLSLQGDFAEHMKALAACGVTPIEVRGFKEVDGLDAIVLPGGESTTFSRLVDDRLYFALKDLISDGMPAMGTCAGLIYLAREVAGARSFQRYLEVLDVEVLRNAYGDQRNSFEAAFSIKGIDGILQAPFIRAPRIMTVGKDVEVLAELPELGPVAVRQGRILGLCFHPELTGDYRVHEYFLSFAKEA